MCRLDREGAAVLAEDGGDVGRHDYKIAILYRHQDSGDATTHIYKRLVEHFGPEAIFADAESIPLGGNFRKFLSDVISHCVVVLVVIGKDWISTTDGSGKRRIDNRDDIVRFELESAFKQATPVIPVLVRDAPMPPACELPRSLRGLALLNATKVRPIPDFEGDIVRLIRALQELLARPKPLPP